MNANGPSANQSMIILSCDGDSNFREGDWLRLWKHTGMGLAHEAFLAVGGVLYDNSGPGGSVRRTSAWSVLSNYPVIEIVARSMPAELAYRIAMAEQRIGTPWTSFYTCQDFISELFTGRPVSFQRDALLGLATGIGILALIGRATR